MNTQNESLEVTEGRKYKKLEALPEEKRELIVELAAHTRLFDLVEILRGHGVETSESTLKRFLRKQRAKEVLEEGEEMREGVEALASRGRGESLRKGTMEALRQKMYDLALTSNDPDTAKELYRDLLKEEAKLKELELEGRKAAAIEEGVRLQRLRIEVMAAAGGRGNSRERSHRSQREGTVIEAGPAIAGELPGPTEREFSEEEELPQKNIAAVAGRAQITKPEGNGEGVEAEENPAVAGQVKGNDEWKEDKARIAELWRRMGEVLNRGARPEEKLLEARAIWEQSAEFLEGI
jgi:hypothetical protein